MAKVKVVYNSTSATALKFRGSVINHVAPKVIFFLLWSTGILLLDQYVFPGGLLRIESSLISLLGLVISLLLVFRTNTAYDRYWEGRRLWSDLSMAVRSISRVVWVQVDEMDGRYSLEVKRKVAHLLIAFAYACMHHLRGEYGIYHDDLYRHLEYIPDLVNSKDITFSDADTISSERAKNFLPAIPVDGVSLPILITHQISSFIADALKNDAINNPIATILIGNLNTLTNSLTGFERILSTPIPAAYAVHLSQTIWLFCLFLPFQVLQIMKSHQWVMILIVAIVAFTMFGIVNIGEEIENPFGLDANDLPLHEYCTLLQKEIESIIRRPPPTIKDWIFSKPISSSHPDKSTIDPKLPPPAHHTILTIPFQYQHLS